MNVKYVIVGVGENKIIWLWKILLLRLLARFLSIWIGYLLLPILIALVVTAQTASTSSDLVGKVIKVIDGDSIKVKPKIGKNIEVRLDMVNTPEIGQKGHQEATAFTRVMSRKTY
jgi:endonuclease YncB( thermonuclease family)